MSGHEFRDNSFDHVTFGGGGNTNLGGTQSVGNSGSQSFGDHSPVVPSPASGDDGGVRHGQAGGPGRAEASGVARSVFVVHGRDEQARREMFELLRRLDLRPKEWEDLVGATGQTAPFLGEVVAAAPAQAQAALVLLTPDDIVTLHPDLYGPNEPSYETQPVGQPRPNVLIELGMVLMAYPERTLIVEIGSLRPIADIAGRNVIRFDGSETALGKVVERLKQAGCAVNDTGSDWRQTWPFRHLSAYQRRP
ncbi:nucleotide-binding protein [Streptomyces sp. NPDC006997]|uniref:nucleotide-binding protein n=1 Tax=Streptomyces sp. NPDC006997 TaxID=3155356 RepID=UPI0033FF673C